MYLCVCVCIIMCMCIIMCVCVLSCCTQELESSYSGVEQALLLSWAKHVRTATAQVRVPGVALHL